MIETRRKKVLIVTARFHLDKDIEEYKKDIRGGLAEGLILLPSGFTYSVEEIDEVYMQASNNYFEVKK